MTENPAQIHERGLARILDCREVWLHHHNAACSLQSTDVLDGKSPLIGIIHAVSA